jgi:hypothetical protein
MIEVRLDLVSDIVSEELPSHPLMRCRRRDTPSFPYDRMTVERFRSAFPGARWRDDLRAWFVPGTTAERRLNRWFGCEMSGVVTYADDRGRDAFAFQPIESR